MLAQYLVSQGATNLRKSRTKNVMTVNILQVNKERTFQIHLLVEASSSFSNNTFYDKASGLALFLICSYFSTKFQARVLTKKSVICIILLHFYFAL